MMCKHLTTIWVFLLSLILQAGWSAQALAQPPKLLEVGVPGGHYVGLPIHWSRLDAVVLEPTGHLHVIDQAQVQSHRVLELDFAPQTLADARNRLQSELGSRYETLVFGPYVLAAPNGTAERWRDRFSALLAGYLRYFEVRGWSLRRPDFPLCVIVFSTRQEFLNYAAAQVQQLPTSVVGSYFPRSNRCVLYHITGVDSGGGESTNWSETEATIVHEAVHQLAYNTGIHQRLSMDPLWFVEGLASMFEQPAVYDLRQQQSTLESRMLRDKQRRLQSLLARPQDLVQHMQSLVVSDELFAQQPDLAYDLAWAMTFYLAERMPTEFRQYTSRLAARPYGDYSAAERASDFRTAFGGDLSLLAVQLTRLLQL